MIDAAPHASFRLDLVAVALGAYAAALALAPSDTVRLILIAPLISIPIGLWALAQPSRWLIAFLCCSLVLPPLPIPIGDSGPHIALGLAALGVFVGFLRMREWMFRFDWVNLALIGYVCLIAASIAFAAIYSGLGLAVVSLARVALFGISIYVFFYTAHGPGSRRVACTFRSLRVVYWAAVASALFACVDFYFQFPAPAGFGAQFVWLEQGVYRRAQGVFYEASTLGNICAFFLVVSAVALAGVASRTREMQPLSRPALFAGIAVFASALMLSFSRASLVNLVVAIVTLLYLQRKRIGLRRLVLVPAVALGAGAVASYSLVPRFAASYWERLSASLMYFSTAPGGILSGRLESWELLGRFLLDNPWHAILGVGYKTLPYSDFIGKPVIADNAYLSALVETGIVGLAAMLLFNVAILRIAYQAARSRDRHAAFYGTCVLCFWLGEMAQMMSGDLLTYWRVLPVYLWMLGMAARHSNEHSPARSIQ